VLAARIARAFDEVNARNGREAPQLVHRELERPLDQPVEKELMLSGIDSGHAGVMALEMQRRRRDDAVQIPERRST
jgi:hypothetical protein